MDGLIVNWKFVQHLQQELIDQFSGRQLLNVGSCGLHTLHNAFKCGFTMWDIDKILKALWYLFQNVPARRDDYTAVTKSDLFSLQFCGHRWVENSPVIERAIGCVFTRRFD